MTSTAARPLFAIRADGFATRYVYAADRAELAALVARHGDRIGFIVVSSRTGKLHKASPGGPQHCNTRWGGFHVSGGLSVSDVSRRSASAFCAKCFGDTFAAALADVVELTADEAATAPAVEAARIAADIAADIAARDARRAANASLTAAERIAAEVAARDAQPEPAARDAHARLRGLQPQAGH